MIIQTREQNIDDAGGETTATTKGVQQKEEARNWYVCKGMVTMMESVLGKK